MVTCGKGQTDGMSILFSEKDINRDLDNFALLKKQKTLSEKSER